MKEKNVAKRLISMLLLLVMLFGILPLNVLAEQVSALTETRKSTKAAETDAGIAVAAEEETAMVRGFYDLNGKIPSYEECYSMQGMTVLDDFVYTVVKDKNDTKATVYRKHRLTAETQRMSIDGSFTVDYLGHGNDMCAAKINGVSYLFVTTMKTSVDVLVCFKINGGSLTLVGIYDVRTKGGSNLTPSGLEIYEVNGTKITFLVGHGTMVFLGTFDVAAPADLYCPLGFEIDRSYMLQVAQEACGVPGLEMTLQGSGFYNDTYYMPVTLHHNEQTEIKVDDHGDSTSVIVAFPNISKEIAVMNSSVKASLKDTIYVPDAGEMFFEIESIGFAEGIMYFNTNRVRIDHSCCMISVLLDPTNMDDFWQRQAYRQDGIYMVSGASATDHFFYDPGTDDKKIIAGVYPAGENTYFGFESNSEGFYYIRSMLTKEYLTVNADGTVTKSAKKENDPSQLFCLTQIHWPDDVGHVAIISLLNYQYLNHASDSSLITTTSGKSFRLKRVNDTAGLEEYLFDYDLYTACYPEETAGMNKDQAKNHFNTVGKAKGYIASIFFDPNYYLAMNADVRVSENYSTLEGAYQHFVTYGFWEGRQGSLYFSNNEYLHSGNYELKKGRWPDKVYHLEHFRIHGANESLDRTDRYGSNEFAIEKVVEKFALTTTGGYAFLVEYISRNVRAAAIRNAEVQSREDLEALLFDWKYYSTKYAAALSEDKLASFAGSTYAAKLYTHWTTYGINEGRNASPYFDAAYYRSHYDDVPESNEAAYEHFVTIGFWEGRTGSFYYDGENYLYGLNPERSLLCDHRYTVTATKDSTCTANGVQTTYCCLCSATTKTVTLPTLDHKDENGDNVCDDCDIIFDSIEHIKLDIDTMLEPAPTNEYFDLTGKTFDNVEVEGTYYMVQHNIDGAYRIFDTLNQSGRGSFPATTVTVKNNAVYGAHPDMAMTFILVEPGTNQDGTWNIQMNGEYYLSYGANTDPNSYTVGETRRMVDAGRLGLRIVTELGADRFRVYRQINSKSHWINLVEDEGFYYYRFTTSVNPNENNTFYLYKLLTDRLFTEDMYASIRAAKALVDSNTLYNSDSYEKFRASLKECIALYEKYNGTILTGDDLASREALQDAFDAKERELINLMAVLRINAEGKSIHYFPANMYNYNEDNMNALVNGMPDADANGFYFESAQNKGNSTAYHSNYDNQTNEQVKGREIRSQMYSITSGIAASDLTGITNPPFANSVVTADFWSETPIENAKEVYTNVGVPFIYEDGYYVLNSDTNAVFFEGEPAGSVKLAISERPAAYHWSGGMNHGIAKQDYNANDYTTFHYADGYVTGFQPFAKMTNRSAMAYIAAASVFEETEPVPSYLIDGVAFNSATKPTIAVSGSGTAVWGFGMKLDVDFKMTDDGRLMDENNTPITFEFSGDDDVWVYIDGKLVLDIGGSHDAIQGVIDFTNGNVIVRSDKYDRIRDKNKNGYGWSDADQYDPADLSEVHSITTNQMYQKNLYSEVFNQTIEEFADDGKVHTLTVYYMDRGKGRTNSMIKFNLPQTDTITVKKDVQCATYENGILSTMTESESASLMNTLAARSFDYTLTDNGAAVANQSYHLMQDGVDLGEMTTGENGGFSLKHGQSAVFTGLNFTSANKYKVVETPVENTWFNVEWSYTTTGNAPVSASTPSVSSTTYNENVSSTVSIDGELYANETITFQCTNTFVIANPEVDEVIVDYGKDMEVDVLQNDPSLMFINGYVRELQGFAPYAGNFDPIAALKTPGQETFTTENGEFSIVNGHVYFAPKKLLETVERLYCVVEYSKGTDFFYLYEELRMIPSNVMYYETDFGEDIFETKANRDFVFLDFGPDDTTTWGGSKRVTVNKNTETGILWGDITGGDPYVSMGNNSKQLHYVTKPGDVVILRAKTTRTSEGGNSTGYEIFLSFADTTDSTGWEMIRNTTHEQGTGMYELLTMEIPAAMIGRTLEEFRFDPFWNGDGNKVLGTYEIDYVYIGQPATAPSSDYLFFDFTDDTEDRLRYQQEQYGGFNGDADPWSANTTDRNSELHEGEDPGTKATTAVYGATACYIRSSENGSFPYVLNHKVKAEDLLQIRFKLKNFVTTGSTPSVGVTAYQNERIDATVSGKDEGITIGTTLYSTTAFDSDEYITVTVPFNANYLTLSKISTFCVFFNQMQSRSETELGEITIDYIYIGSAEDFTKAMLYNRTEWTTYSDVSAMETADDDEGNLFFDFTNDEEDQLRYAQSQYGGLGINYDTEHWTIREQTMTKADLKYYNNVGIITDTAKRSQNQADRYYYYYQISESIGEGYHLQYDPSNAEAIYLRVRMENFAVHGAPKLTVGYYQSADSSGTLASLSDVSLEPAQIESGEYFTIRIPATELQSLTEPITAFRFTFANIDNGEMEAGRISLDYVYIGTEAGYLRAMRHSRGETNPDNLQDSGLVNDNAYLLLDFNEGDKTIWNYLSGTTAVKDTAAGVLRGKLTDGDNWFGMRNDSRQVSYTFKKGDVIQARMKITLDDPALKRTGFQVYFRNGIDSVSYEIKDNDYDHVTGEYSVITIAIPERFWGMDMVSFRIDPLTNSAPGTYELDYIYFGQPNQAPGFSADQRDYILFSFDEDDLAQTRSRQSVYGGFNGETSPWTTNATKNTGLSDGEEKGTRVFYAAPGNKDRYHYISSCDNGMYGYSLNHKPNIDDVVQIRVKFENFVLGNTANPYVAFSYYTGSNIYNDLDKSNGDQGVVMRHFYFDGAYLNANEYITLTIPVTEAYAAVERISTFRLFFNEMVSVSDEQLGKVTIDYIYLGPEETAPSENKMVLGYDSSYENDMLYSNGSSLYTEGLGVPLLNSDKTMKDCSYNGTSFTFSGTGFDILSRTGAQQGALRVFIYDENGNYVRVVSVVNKSDKNLELYQIPVVSVNDLPFGTYTVHTFVNAAYDYGNDGNADNFGGGLDRGGEFYFDAVRIYNPIDTSWAACKQNESSRLAYEAYLKVSEADQNLTEVRQSVLDSGNFTAGGTVSGVLYLDNTDAKIEIGTYEKLGPNNETYLAAGQGIAFKIVVEGMVPDSIDLSGKAAQGVPSLLQISANAKAPVSFGASQVEEITASTLQNYSVNIPASAWTTNGKTSSTYVTVYNKTGGILSIADIKYAYDAVKLPNATKSIRFLVDEEMVEAIMSGEPTEDANLTYGAQLYLENDLTMAFRVKNSKLEAYDVDTAYLVVEREVYATGAAEAVTESTVIEEYSVDGDRLVFSYPGIAAAQMNDSIRATLYVQDAAGREFRSPVLTTSVATYLDGLLQSNPSDDKLVTLIMDMVNYGAAAQIYFDRHTDALVNEAFDSFKTYANCASVDFAAALEDLSGSTSNGGAAGKMNLSLDLGTRVGIQYKLTLPEGISAQDVTVLVTDAEGNTLESLEVASCATDDRGRYLVNFYGSTSRDMRRIVYATAYVGETPITATYAYSISTYAWGIQENAEALGNPALVALTRAMMLYGDSANSYFT